MKLVMIPEGKETGDECARMLNDISNVLSPEHMWLPNYEGFKKIKEMYVMEAKK